MSWDYIEVPETATTEDIKVKSIIATRKSYDRSNSTGWRFSRVLAQPTIVIEEYDNEKKRKVRNGISIKTKWR